MIYTVNNVQALNERSEASVKFAVAIEKFKKWFLGQEMDTKKIDKLIRKIEDCNRNLQKVMDDPNDKNAEEKLLNDETYARSIIKEFLWIVPAAAAVGMTAATNLLLGAVVDGMFILLINSRLNPDIFYNKLMKENNKALEWLKEERDAINFKKNRKEGNKEDTFSDDVKTESTIFESVAFI